MPTAMSTARTCVEVPDVGSAARASRSVVGQLLLLVASCGLGLTAAEQDVFTKTIHPILEARCFSCHGEKKQKGGLRLDSLEATLKGGESGPSAISGNAAKSMMIRAIKRVGDVQMPPKEPLPAEEIDALEKWVAGGMNWRGKPSHLGDQNSS